MTAASPRAIAARNLVILMMILPLCLVRALSGWPPVLSTVADNGFLRKNPLLAGSCLCGYSTTMLLIHRQEAAYLGEIPLAQTRSIHRMPEIRLI
jgi:hypothetical protein